MRKNIRKILGVTLLEIMLVLAIAAMVIIMSVRYYQSSTVSSQTNSVMSTIQAITAQADNIAQGGGGSYSASVSQALLSNIMGSAAMMSPTNQAITFTATGATTFDVDIPLNDQICAAVEAKLSGNPKFTSVACSGGTLTYTYDSTQS